jgi:hypothetical protein
VSASEAIARLRELRAKATAGEWHSEAGYVMHANDPIARCIWLLGDEQAKSSENAAAIVAAMNSLPALLECAEALEYLLEACIANHDAKSKARAALQALAEGGGE